MEDFDLLDIDFEQEKMQNYRSNSRVTKDDIFYQNAITPDNMI